MTPGRAPRGARGLKFNGYSAPMVDVKSCPSRGTWIEMAVLEAFRLVRTVVPLAGHVD